ncbi:hypothetical protein BDN72DRAFT_965616 [Pluteus cervinus]|uniref:Uncharacterized protein n=1 Tax=Pluteus cervinus TaxID=181527 RepID=A0ACD3A4E9_9AGAR|nr:hypothetical protein BDN72DRAFT_965616 [Pluteus cervinus]
MTIPDDTPEWLNPASRLEDLYLEGLTLPPNVFSGQTPCLTSLSLNSCTHDWDTLLVFRGLKSLSIAYPVSHSTVDSIIKILELNGPHIEEVRLQNVFFSDGVAPSNSSLGKVRLEKLKYLKLEDDESTSIARFFHYLAFPPHRMNIEIETLESAELSLVPSLISARNLEKWPIHHLEIKVESDHACLRITEDWPNGNELADELDDVDTQSHIQIDIMTVDDPQQLLPLLILFPIHPIERVSFMGGHSEPQNPIILEYMGKLETIRELSLELPFLDTFVVLTDQEGEKLQSAVDEGTLADIGGTQDVENTNFARTILSFHGLRHLDIYGRSQDGYILTSHDLLNLKTWLEWRKRFNFQLEKLSISGLTTPPISWLSGVFDGLVGEFQTENLNELESEDGALII